MNIIKATDSLDIPKNYTGIVEFPYGTKCWWLEDNFYPQINLKDYVVLDSYQGNYNLVWYKLLGKNEIFEYSDIPGLITKESLLTLTKTTIRKFFKRLLKLVIPSLS